MIEHGKAGESAHRMYETQAGVHDANRPDWLTPGLQTPAPTHGGGPFVESVRDWPAIRSRFLRLWLIYLTLAMSGSLLFGGGSLPARFVWAVMHTIWVGSLVCAAVAWFTTRKRDVTVHPQPANPTGEPVGWMPDPGETTVWQEPPYSLPAPYQAPPPVSENPGRPTFQPPPATGPAAGAGLQGTEPRADLPGHVTRWRVGAEAEERTARILAALPDTWECWHDLAVPGTKANIDHLLIGPPGPVVVDTKAWAGTVTVTGGRLVSDTGRDLSGTVPTIEYELAQLTSVASARAGGRVLPSFVLVVAVHGARKGQPPAQLQGVFPTWLVDADDLPRFLGSLPAEPVYVDAFRSTIRPLLP